MTNTKQMNAARKGIVTEQMKRVAEKEHLPVEQLRELVIKPGLVTVAAEGDCRAEWQLIRCGLGQLAGKYPACVRLEA